MCLQSRPPDHSERRLHNTEVSCEGRAIGTSADFVSFTSLLGSMISCAELERVRALWCRSHGGKPEDKWGGEEDVCQASRSASLTRSLTRL